MRAGLTCNVAGVEGPLFLLTYFCAVSTACWMGALNYQVYYQQKTGTAPASRPVR